MSFSQRTGMNGRYGLTVSVSALNTERSVEMLVASWLSIVDAVEMDRRSTKPKRLWSDLTSSWLTLFLAGLATAVFLAVTERSSIAFANWESNLMVTSVWKMEKHPWVELTLTVRDGAAEWGDCHEGFEKDRNRRFYSWCKNRTRFFHLLIEKVVSMKSIDD